MIAGAMVEPSTLVVEVTEIVPAEDVPYVAARVAERLGMPLERVRKLIDDRTGPITRPLRPDKADAIAQTFEAAGVVVAIRPATEADEDLASGRPASTESTVAGAAAAPSAEPEPAAPPDQVEPERHVHREPEEHEPVEPRDEVQVEPPPSEPEEPEEPEEPVDLVQAAQSDIEPPSEPGVEPDAESGPEGETEPEAEPQPAEPGDAPDAAQVDTGVFADWFDGEAEGIVIEVPEDHGAGASGVAAEPGHREHAGLVRSDAGAAAASPVAQLRLEPDDEVDDTNDPGEFGLVARGEVVVRLPSGAYPAVDVEVATWPEQTDQGDDAGDDDERERPAADHERTAGSPGDRPRPMAPFGDPGSWHADDDPSGGWRIGPRAGRRLEVVTDESTLAELAEEPATRPADVAAAAAAPQSIPSAEVEGVASGTSGDADAEDEDPAAPGADAVVHVPPPGIAERRTPPRLGRASRVSRPPGAAAADREGGAVPTMGAPDAPVVPAANGPTDAEAQTEARVVPTAWRGLGSDERGPARPVDARLPRRQLGTENASAQRESALAVTRRRTAMLVTLAIALALFVLAQAWVAGRAAPAFDAGLHRFRDADFGAAQRVWTDLASAGDVNAQFMLGYLSEAGLGRPWSARAAASWYRLSADAGHAEAQWRLANLYAQGLGVPHEPASAERWWAAAASGGHAEAAFVLGRSRLEGTSGPSDPAGARVAFERALALGWPAAAPYRDALLAVLGQPPPATP